MKPVTIESLVFEPARSRAGGTGGFRFCSEPSCDVAYYHPESGARIARSEVRVRIGQKETKPPRSVCYCFDHTVEEIEAEVAASGSSKVADDITEKCRQGLDHCAETNPQGSCCLGNVHRAIQDAQRRHAGVFEATNVSGGEAEGESCCAVGSEPVAVTPRTGNTGLWATGGAVISAILSSACCWLPLLLIAFGASAAGVAGFFEAYRPYFLAATGLLLTGGFYLVYFRVEKCGPGEACAVPNRRLRRFNAVTLWVATVVVFAFAFFPTYVGRLLGNGSPPALTAAPAMGESRCFRIEGMTCEACGGTLAASLGRVPGVARAVVSFDSKIARVSFTSGLNAPSDEALLAAIRQAGYSGALVSSVRTVQIAVGGMTCAGCATGLEAHLRTLAGVEDARVDDESARATITIARGVRLDTVLEAIATQGLTGRVVRVSE